MGSTEVLSRSVQRTHVTLAQELEVLRTQFGPPGTHAELDGPHRGYPPIDEFVTTASRHLHAVNQVLVPRARKELPDGKQVAHDYLDAMRVLEVVLAHELAMPQWLGLVAAAGCVTLLRALAMLTGWKLPAWRADGE